VKDSRAKWGAVSVLALVVATAASGSDLTGTWVGAFQCKGLDAAGAPNTTASDGVSVIEISQAGIDLAVSVDGQIYSGTAVDRAGKEDQQGVAVMEACENDGDPTAASVMALLSFKVTPGAAAGALKTLSVTAEDGAATCKGSWRRVDSADPVVADCPVFYSCVCTGALGCGLLGSGAAGALGDVVSDLGDSERTADYENGNSNGWVCVAQ
jgi:hypothetical protein